MFILQHTLQSYSCDSHVLKHRENCSVCAKTRMCDSEQHGKV